MHAAFIETPKTDYGFVSGIDGDLFCSNPVGSQMDPNCGMARDVNGDIYFTGITPTTGFLTPDPNSAGDFAFRTI